MACSFVLNKSENQIWRDRDITVVFLRFEDLMQPFGLSKTCVHSVILIQAFSLSLIQTEAHRLFKRQMQIGLIFSFLFFFAILTTATLDVTYPRKNIKIK